MNIRKRTSHSIRIASLLALSVAGISAMTAAPARAADVFKWTSGTALNLAAAWTGDGTLATQTGNAPTATDVAVFLSGSGPTNGTLTAGIGAATSWQGIRVAAGAPILNFSANTFALTLGSAGIDMSAATSNLTMANTITLGAVQVWNVGTSDILTSNGIITGTGNSLTKSGAGTLVLNNSSTSLNTFTGGFIQSAGTTIMNSTGSFGAAANLVTMTGGTIRIATTASVPQAFSVNGTAALDSAAGGTFAGAFSANSSSTLNFLMNGNTESLNGGANQFQNFFGTITVNSGFFRIQGATDHNFGNANVQLTGTATFNNRDGSNQTIGALSGVVGTTLSGPASAGSAMVYIIGNLNTATTMSGAINNGAFGAVTIRKVGTGTLSLTSTISNYTGSTDIFAGTLEFSNSAALGAATSSGNLLFNATNNGAFTSTLRYTGSAPTSLARTFTINGSGNAVIDVQNNPGAQLNFTATGAIAASATGTLTLSGSNTLPNTFSPAINSGKLVKTGSNTWILTGANGFSGGTTVSQGALIANLGVTNNVTGSGPITVAAAGTYGGIGNNILVGDASVSGHIAPGVPGVNNSVGTINFNNLNMQNNAVLDVDVTTLSNDQVNLYGVASTSTFTVGSLLGVNIFQAGTTTPFAYNTTLTLFTNIDPTKFVGNNMTGNVINNFSNATPGIAYTSTFQVAPDSVNPALNDIQLVISGAANLGTWRGDGDGAWAVGNPGFDALPSVAGDSAVFGNVISATRTVSLNSDKTVGQMAFNATAGAGTGGYLIAAGAPGGKLILDNGASPVLITNSSGSNLISANVQLNSSLGIFASANTLTISGVISGGAGQPISITGSGAVVFAGADNYTGITTVAAASTLQFNDGGTMAAGTTIANSGTVVLNHSDAYTLPSIFTGAGTLTKIGAGTATLTGLSTGSGPININAGIAVVGPGAALGNGANLITVGANGMLDVGANNITAPGLVLGGTVTNTSGSSSTLTLKPTAAAVTFGGVLTNGPGSPLNLIVSGTGLASGGTITLNSVNSYTGKTIFSNGSFSAAQIIVGVSGAIPTASEIDIGSTNGPKPLALANNVNLASPIVIQTNQATGNAEFINVLANATATYSGNLTVFTGIATTAQDYGNSLTRFATGATTSNLIITGNINSAPATGTAFNPLMFTNGNIVLDGATADSGVSAFVLSRVATTTTNITLQNNASITSNVAANGQGASIGGTTTQTGPVNITVNNARLNLNTGTFGLNDGSSAATSNITFTNGGKITTSGFTKTSTGASTLTLDGGIINASASNAAFVPNNATLTFNLAAGGGTLGLLNNATIGVLKAITGIGGLVVTGAGKATLSGANAYSGDTTVSNNAILELAGSVGRVTVNSGSTLNATPLGSVGTLTMTTLTLAGGSFSNFDLSAVSGNDILNSTSALVLGSNPIGIGLYDATTGLPYGRNGIFTLFNAPSVPDAATVAGIFGNTVTNPASGASYVFGTNNASTSITVTISGLISVGTWNIDGNGSWGSAGSWSGDIPNSQFAIAQFFGAVTAPTIAGTVTLDGDRTVGTINFNDTAASYVINQGTSGTLFLDNGSQSAQILVTGSHTINAPLTANSSLVITDNAGSTLTLGTVVGNSTVSATLAAASALVANSITAVGNITVAGTTSTFTVNNGLTSSGGSVTLTPNASAFTVNGGLSSSGPVNVTTTTGTFTEGGNLVAGGAMTFATGTTGVQTINGNISAGANTLAITGTGTVILTGTNVYATTTNSAFLQLGNNTAAGSLGSGSITNTGTLAFKYSTPNTVAQLITGAGAVQDLGPGKVTLTAAETYTGTTTVGTGATLNIDYNTGSLLAASTLVLNGAITFTGGSAGGTQSVTAPIALNNGGAIKVIGGAGGTMAVSFSGTPTIAANATVSIVVDGTNGSASFAPGSFSVGANSIQNMSVGGPFDSTLTLTNGGWGSLNLSVTAGGHAIFTSATPSFNAGSLITVGGANGTVVVNSAATFNSTINVNDGGSATFNGVTFNTGSALNVTGGAAGAIASLGAITFNGAGSISIGGSPVPGTVTFTSATYNVRGEYNIASGAAINLGTLARGGYGAVNLAGAGTFNSTVANNAGGIVGGWATINGNEFASADGASLSIAGNSVDDLWADGNNTNVTTSDSPAPGSTTNSIRFKTAGAAVLTLAGSNTLTAGAILVSSDVGANLTTITGGSLAAPAGQDLVINQRNTAGDLAIGTALTGTNINKVGPGTVIFNAQGTGNLEVAEGIVKSGGNNLLPNSLYSVAAGATVDLQGFSQSITGVGSGTGAITNTSGTASTLLVNPATTTTMSPTTTTVSGNINLEKTGTGTLTISGQKTYTGKTTVDAGLLFVDPTNVNVNVLPTTSILVMNGGTLQFGNLTNTTDGIKFASTTINSGSSSISQNTRTSNAHPYILLGAITRNIGTVVDITGNTGSSSTMTDATTGIFTATANGTSGILGGWATYNNGTEWAVKNTSNSSVDNTQAHIYGGATYTNTLVSTTNTDMTANLSAAAGTVTGSLRFNTAAANSLNLGAFSGTIGSGGILVTTTVANNASTITGGSLTSGNGQDLIVIQNNTSTAGALTIASVIANPTSGNIGLTKAGGGVLIASGINSYTGPTTVIGGTLRVNGSITSNVSVANGASIGGIGTITGTVAVADGAAINLVDGSINTLSIGGNLTVGGAAAGASTLRFEVGSTADAVNLGTNQLIVNPGGATFAFTDLGVATGTYTLMTYASGTNLAGLVGGSTLIGFNPGTITVNPTNVTLVVSAGSSTPVNAFWTGTQGANWNANNGGLANFNDAAVSGNNTAALPGANTTVIFATTTPPATNLATTLGQNFSINGVQVQSGIAAVSISGNTLSIGAGGITVDNASNGLTINSTLNAQPFVQTWTGGNTAASSLTLTGVVSGTGTVTLAGNIAFTSAVSNTLSGPVTVTGNIQMTRGATAANSAITTGTITGGGGTITYSGGTNGVVNNLNLPAGSSLTLSNVAATAANVNFNNTAIGSGHLYIAMGGGSSNFSFGGSANLTGFTGITTVSSGYLRWVGNNTDHGFGNSTLELVNNGGLRDRDGGIAGFNIGALTGDATGYLAGATQNNTVSTYQTTYNIGSLASSTFSGSFLNGNTGGVMTPTAFIKTGNTTLTLNGATNSNFTGVVTVSQGVLEINSLTNGGVTTSGASTTGTNTLTVGSTANLAVGMQVVGDTIDVGSPGSTAYTTSTITDITGNIVTLSKNALATNAAIGNLRVGTGNPLGLSSNAASNLVLDGGTLRYTGPAGSTDRLFTIGGGNATLESSGTGAVNFANTGSLGVTGTSRTLTLGGSNTDANILAAVIPDANTSLIKNGASTWLLTGVNTYGGTTTVNNGNLKVAVTGAVPTASTVDVHGGVVQLGSGVNLGSNIVLDTANEFLALPDNGNATLGGNISMGADPGRAYRLGYTGSGQLTVTGAHTVADASPTAITQGNITFNGGSLSSNTAIALGSGGAAPLNLVLQNGASISGTSLNTGNGQATPTSVAVTINDTSRLSAGTGNYDLHNMTAAISDSTVNLNGGSLTVGGFIKSQTGATQTATLNLNGGKIVVSQDNTAFLPATPGLTAKVLAGGAVIDTGTATPHAIQISQPLVTGLTLNVRNNSFENPSAGGTFTVDTVSQTGGNGNLGSWSANDTGGKPYGVQANGNSGVSGNSDASAQNLFINSTGTNIYQDVGVLAANTSYTLTLAMAAPAFMKFGTYDGNGGPSAQFQLLNGTDDSGAVLATSGIINTLQTGVFNDYSISATTGNSVSGDLTIAMSQMNPDTNGSVYQANFDNVRIVASTPDGGLSLMGNGSLTLTANNSYSGSTVIGAGSTLQVGNAGATGSLGGGAVANSGKLVFNRSDTIKVSNNIAGSGTLIQAGVGTTKLTGTNAPAATVISAGTLQIGDAGTSGSLGTGPITANGTLKYNRTDAIAVNNVISGTGTLSQAGTGTVTLGQNLALSGAVSVTAGMLAVMPDGASHAAVVMNVSSLTVTGGKLDLQDRDMIIRNPGGNLADDVPITNLGNLIHSGLQGGSGIMSSAAILAGNTTLGFGYAGDFHITNFDGVDVAPTDMLVRYVGKGDANFDGQTDAADLDKIFSLLGGLYDGPYFGQGDLNGDGQVDAADLDQVFQDLGNLVGGDYHPLGGLSSLGDLGISAVPEPTSLVVLGLGGLALLSRRRRK